MLPTESSTSPGIPRSLATSSIFAASRSVIDRSASGKRRLILSAASLPKRPAPRTRISRGGKMSGKLFEAELFEVIFRLCHL